MKLPKKIKVLSQDYKVEALDPKEAEEKSILGKCDDTLSVISINTKAASRRQAETLVHEILHAISFCMAMDCKRFRCEEDMVNPMTNGLAAVMRDNPKVFQDILKALK